MTSKQPSGDPCLSNSISSPLKEQELALEESINKIISNNIRPKPLPQISRQDSIELFTKRNQRN